jgi:hypothetical protein
MGGARNQRIAGGRVLQPQGVIHAGWAAYGALPVPRNGPRPAGVFSWLQSKSPESTTILNSQGWSGMGGESP